MARPTKEKEHLFSKRQELIWALDLQEYNGEDIGTIFGISRSVVHRILHSRPKDWAPKWRKVQV